MVCGATEWSLIRTFGESQLSWLNRFGSFSNSIPSEDTLERVFAVLDSKVFNECFMDWINSIRKTTKGEVVVIDGKTMRELKLQKEKKVWRTLFLLFHTIMICV